MQYRKFGKSDFQVSALSMGCMRLPRMVNEKNETVVDREKAYEMIRYAADNGINYFDSAYTYHANTSEEVLGEALEGGRREKVKIATKQNFNTMGNLSTGGGKDLYDNIRRNLEITLKRLRTSYLDLYLIHGIGSGNWEEIKNKKIIDEYEKFRAEGLIKGIAFSYHGALPCFKDAVEFYDWDMCQVQHNFMDTDREVTAEGIRLAGKRNIAVVVMEPLRGGSLCTPPDRISAIYNEFPQKRKGAEWAFRFVLDYPETSTALSGMSTMEQLKENLELFSTADLSPGCVTPAEKDIYVRVKKSYESVKSIPCTTCEYCMPCPKGVNIPAIFTRYNEGFMYDNFVPPQRTYMFLTRQGADVSKCENCGECDKKCPQGIEVYKQLQVAHNKLKGWKEE